MLDTASVYHPDHPDNARMLSAEMEPPGGTPPWTEVVWPLFSHIDGPVIEAARRAGHISVARFRALSAEMPRYDLEPQLGEIDVPTLVIHGRHDTSMPIGQGEIVGQRIPGAKLVIIEHSGHFPFWEQPAEFDAAVRSFLDRTISGGEPTGGS